MYVVSVSPSHHIWLGQFLCALLAFTGSVVSFYCFITTFSTFMLVTKPESVVSITQYCIKCLFVCTLHRHIPAISPLLLTEAEHLLKHKPNGVLPNTLNPFRISFSVLIPARSIVCQHWSWPPQSPLPWYLVSTFFSFFFLSALIRYTPTYFLAFKELVTRKAANCLTLWWS